MVMPFFNWREDSSEDDISKCPYPPETPVAPPHMPPIPEILTVFQEFLFTTFSAI
jgi:hypothetical protein